MPTKKISKKSKVKSKSATISQPVNQLDTPTIVTVLLLIFAYPIGWIVMMLWPRWQAWLKWVISIPLIGFLFVMLAILLIAVNGPKPGVKNQDTKMEQQLNEVVKRSCDKVCKYNAEQGEDYQACYDSCVVTPTP